MSERTVVPAKGDVSTAAPAFVLEPMTETHIPEILQIEQAGFSNPWRKSDFQFSLSKEGSCCLVAMSGDRLIGYTVGFFVLPEFHLADFAIHPDLHRRGLGRRLLGRLVDLLKEREVQVVTLEVRASNEAAIALYTNSGFHTVAIRSGYYSRPKEDALVMLRPLRGNVSGWVAELHPGI